MSTTATTPCFQCGQETREPVTAPVSGEDRHFCCHGCKLAAELVSELGLDGYFARREGFGRRPGERAYPFEDAGFAATLVVAEGDRHMVELALDGLHCAACVWLVEQALLKVPGVEQARVLLGAGRVVIRWDARETPLHELVDRIEALGYAASPYDPSGQDRRARKEGRVALMRLGVAGLGSLAAMFVGEAYNRGGFALEHHGLQLLLGWSGLLLALPAALYAGKPFLKGATSALRAHRLTMDVSIAIAGLAAYVASVWAVLGGHGAVYFDCLLEFLFFLLLGRTVEGFARRRVFAQAEAQWKVESPRACRVEGDEERGVATSSLRVGDVVRVRPGERIPADGTVLMGEGSVDESMLTGEAVPLAKREGSEVTAGTLNLEGSLLVRTDRVGADTTLAQIVRWVEEGDSSRSPSEELANRVSAWFLPLMLGVAATTFLLTLDRGFDTALTHTISVLIVTCPCALGLATPAAITVAMARGARDGVLFKGGRELEALRTLTRLALDKTGTLTTGHMRVAAVHPAPGWTERTVLEVAAGLEGLSEHPLARAVTERARALDIAPLPIEAFVSHPGRGVEGLLYGVSVRVGTLAWLDREVPEGIAVPDPTRTSLYLAIEKAIVGMIEVADTIRPDAAEAIALLRSRGVEPVLVTGDRHEVAQEIALALGIQRVLAGARPSAKRRFLRAMRQEDQVVGMLGDGVNDAPAMASANLGIAMGRGSALTARAAGVVLLGDRLGQLAEAIRLSDRTAGVIRLNFGLSAVYNLIVVPLAALGWVAPQWAALLMPASSLMVLVNSLRLVR